MADYEKLGMFYLGKTYDTAKKQLLDDLLLYDSKDLVTHGVCIGMTGSGKTGLCIGLLEEAAIDNIPALIIDPKGDMTNLMLSFPGLSAAEFAPWINVDDARQQGQSPEAFAAAQAEIWKNGLAQWGQDGARIQKLRDAADFTIFTPGSTSGVPVSILNSFVCPGEEIVQDREAVGDLISTTVTGLLGLIGVNADPIKSREHILVSNIFYHFWQNGQNLDLALLINAIQTPPFERVGAFAVDSFYPARERFELALAFNNLLAAPGFSTWLTGEALDIGTLLYGKSGKPRMSIFYIAHLSDSERMFFVTLLLNQIVSWMRAQPGTTSLRAILYMDEVAGYLPPVAAPPSKKPLMIMLKQARAFGVGVMLATQNPVDLDYKALSNTGTWFIGRLQTQQDIDKVLSGLRSSAGDLDPNLSKSIASLGKRVFLMKNIHEKEPVIFQTRWALSYLRGPLTLAQIKQLTKAAHVSSPAQAGERAVTAPGPQLRPAIPPQIKEFFAPVRGAKAAQARLLYRPVLFGIADVHFGASTNRRYTQWTPVLEGAVPVDWDQARDTVLTDADLEKNPLQGAHFDKLPASAARPESYKRWAAEFADALFRNAQLESYKSSSLKIASHPGENERDFRVRISHIAREKRDAAVETLRKRYATKEATLEDRIQRAQQKLQKEKSDFRTQNVQTAVSLGTTLLGALLGRKTISTTTLNRAGTAMRSGMRSAKERGDIGSAEESLDVLLQRRADLQTELAQEIALIEEQTDPMQQRLEVTAVRPRKSDIDIRFTTLLWLPFWQTDGGDPQQAFE